jgi:uncharacterized membrane protein YccC
MLETDDPTFANWDQDATATSERYDLQDPALVQSELNEAAQTLTATLTKITGDTWSRTGNRSDGSRFTIRTLTLYLIHDPVHHLHDVALQPDVTQE